MPFADLPGVRLHYTDEGSGQPVLLIHGWTCDIDDWRSQIPALVPSFRVVAVDLRGHGRSEAADSSYSPCELAEDVVALARYLRLERVIAVGHSLGGALALLLAAYHPTLVRAVVSIDGAFGVAEEQRQAAEGLVDVARREGAAMRWPPIARWYTDSTPQALIEAHRERAARVAGFVVLRTIEGITSGEGSPFFREAAAGLLGRVAAPVLSVWADARRAAWMGERRGGHSASLVEAWEGVGHWLHQEQPERFNRLLLGWLGEVVGGPGGR